MNVVRKLVSGKRNRFQATRYDLDITYVTRRVAGMSFPASGFEQIYRNNINDVCMLDLRVLGRGLPGRTTPRQLPDFQPEQSQVRL